MAMHWCEKRAAVAQVGAELNRRGWKLCGWKDDNSDAMTDYYDPESWDGVATHLERPGVVVVVNASEYTVSSRSGGESLTRYVPGDPCPRCKGTQADPDGWTLREAQANPSGYHGSVEAFHGHGTRALIRTVVSPIPFFGCASQAETTDYPRELSGRERCRQCSGRGHMLRSEQYVKPWPVFQANPKGCTWHVERDGRIIASGTGVYAVEDRFLSGAKPKLAALVDRIERAADSAGSTVDVRDADEDRPADGAIVRVGRRADVVEVVFDAKPAADVRDELKAAGFRWAKGSGCWYGPAEKLPTRYGAAPKSEQGHAPDIDVAMGY